MAVGAFERRGEKSFTTRVKRLIGTDYAAQMRLGAIHSLGLMGALIFATSIFFLTPRTAFSETMPKDPETCCYDLIKAIAGHDHATAKKLLAEGGDADCAIKQFGTPLIAAAKVGDFGMIKYLVKNGADIDQASPGLNNPLITAVAYGQYDAMKKLIYLGADINASTDGNTALIMAVHRDKANIVKYLVKKGADVGQTTKGRNGEPLSAIREAKEMGHKDIYKYLKKTPIGKTRLVGISKL